MSRDSSSAVELQLRAAIDAAPSGVVMTDADGRIVLVNRQIESTFGYSREELLGKPVELLVPAAACTEHVADRGRFMRDPAVRAMGAGRELHGVHRNGTPIPVEIGLTPVATDTGMFVLATVVDISSRKRAEERFRVAVESSPNGMIMIDRDGRLLLVNREIERMFGYSRDECMGLCVEMLVPERFRASHPSDRAAFHASPHARAMGAGRDLFGVRKDGTEFPIEIGLNPIQSEEGMLVLASIVDITARKRSESDRRRLEDQLRQSQKMEAIGRLAGGIAHDFNNLLMGIHGCAELVKRGLHPDHPLALTVQDICDAAKRGASLTRDLLDFSRRKPTDAVASDLNAVVRVAERMLRQVIGEDVELVVELGAETGSVLANPTHVEHILMNLAVNARDAMPKGGRLRITTSDRSLPSGQPTRGRVLPPGDYVVLEVEDAGIGMDTATQSRLFEPYFTTKPLGQGTGLGLYTVYSLIDQLEGGIDVVSEVGKGTCFAIWFPLHRGEPALTAAVQPHTSKSKRTGPSRILILEDERLIRATLRQMVTNLGHEVLIAENGTRALELAASVDGPIDLLLSDIVLPDTSGIEVARALSAKRPSLRVLFMSAYPAAQLVQQGRIQPGTKTLEKPFDEQTLANAIADALTGTEYFAQHALV